MPASTAQATPELNTTDASGGNNITSVMMTTGGPNNGTTGGPNNGTTVENNSTRPAITTTPNGGGPDVKASLLFSVLPLVLYAISL